MHHDVNRFTWTFPFSVVQEISELIAAPPKSPRKTKVRYIQSLPISFDKNTSRNQITHHPTYHRFPINVEEPQCRKSSTDGEKEKKMKAGEEKREREMTRYMVFLNREKCLSRGFTKSWDSFLRSRKGG